MRCKVCQGVIKQNSLGNWFHVNAMEYVHSVAVPPKISSFDQPSTFALDFCRSVSKHGEPCILVEGHLQPHEFDVTWRDQ